jgi:hypothetical protein
MIPRSLGKKCWVVPDGYIPRVTEHDRENRNNYVSHECVCLLNTGPNDVRVELAIYYEDQAPVVLKKILMAAQRCLHLRMDELTKDGVPVIKRGRPYALVVTGSEPIIVQMSRLDTTQVNMALLSTMAYPVE